MSHSFLVYFALVLTLLDAGRVHCQTTETGSPMPAPQLVTSLISVPDPEAPDSKNRIMAQERELKIVFRSKSHGEEITIQELKRGVQNLAIPGPANFCEGEVSFGTKPRFQLRTKMANWRPFRWRFDLRGFAEMCCMDPFEFNGTNYELKYRGAETLLGKLCSVYLVKPKEHAKGWHFEGTIWVLPDRLAIVRAKGSFHPIRKILWYFPVEDHLYRFDSWRKEISPGSWVPGFTCTGVSVSESDFMNPAFHGRIVYFGPGTQPGVAAEHACGMKSVLFRAHKPCSQSPAPGRSKSRIRADKSKPA
jgi:hypothetical protein